MNIGNPVKENTKKSVECIASSTNLASSVDMKFYIDGIRKTDHIILQRTERNGSHNGTVHTFVFTFTSERSMNGKIAKCSLHWNGKHMQKDVEAKINITCK